MSKDNALEKLFFNGVSYKELYKLNNPKITKDYYINKGEKLFFLKGKRKDTKIYFFFFNPISVIFQNVKINEAIEDFEINKIYSSIQIEDYFHKFNITNAKIVFKNSKLIYANKKINIDNFIENDKLIIYNSTIPYEKYSFNGKIIKDTEYKFNPENLSKYFYNYFPYNTKNNNIFEYDYTQNRKILNFFLKTLLFSDDLNFFKFCGPTSTGKSTTLLKFSREFNNIIYLNLKVIYHLEQDDKNIECYNLIVYEFGRLEFEDEKENENFQKFLNLECQNKSTMIILIYKILNYIKDQNYIIIFDQFKMKYISKTIFDKIEKLIKISKLKLILCSSINDKDIKDEVIKTINNFGGNITELNLYTQDYFFYFSQNFFKKEISGNCELDELFQLFDYKPKYKYLLINCKNNHEEVEKIKNKIKNNVSGFFKNEKDLDLSTILLNLKNKINVKYKYSQFSNIIKTVPLKYYILNFEKEYFQINYLFELMKILEKENLTDKECTNYFKEHKYLLDKSFDVKEEFFKMSAKFFIEINHVLPMVINEKINVKNIVDMEIIENENPKTMEKIHETKRREIEIVKQLLKDNDIDSREKLDLKYSKKKNINYYLINQALNYWEKNKINDEDEKEEKGKEKEKKKRTKKEAINKIENIYEKDPDELLKRKRKRETKEENFFLNNIGDENILINQEDVNGKTLDQAFIFGEEDNKIFLGIQMKCLSDKVDNSTALKNINKEDIKKYCQSVLLLCKFDLNIQIKEWHYILFAYYNKKDKENIYCKQLERHCKCYDLEIVYFDPEEQHLYDKEFKKIKEISISNISNLDYDFPESNPYNMIYNEENNDLINSYYNQRIDKLSMENYYEEENINNLFINWLKDTNIKQNELENSLKELCRAKNLKLIDNYELDDNFPIPSPAKGYIFLFKNKKRNNIICYYHDEGLRAINLENIEEIKILKLPIYIDTEEKYFFIFGFSK